MTRYDVKSEYANQLFGGDADTSYVDECLKYGIPEDDVIFLYGEWGPEIFKMIDIDDDPTVVPSVGVDGSVSLHLGTWDEYREAIEEAVGFLYEPHNNNYKGEEPEELVDTYNYTWRFAKDVCKRIDKLIKEKEE